MPGPITQDEAFSAIETLLKKGLPTTQRNLRQELGGRGSGPRLKGFIEAFYAEYGHALMSPPSSAAEGGKAGRSLCPGNFHAPVLVPGTIPVDSPWRPVIDLLSAWELDLLNREKILSRREIDLQRKLDR